MIAMIKCTRRQPIFFICIFIFLFILAYSIDEGHAGGKVELIHCHDQSGGGAPLERMRQLINRDTIRLHGISRKLMSRKQEKNGYETGVPIHSAADYGAGLYLVKLRVGSPPQKLELIADTGSDLSWSNCRYRCPGGRCGRESQRRRGRGRVFRADRSSSFRTVPCSSTICKVDLANLFSLSSCPSPLDPCAYDYRYSDGSATVGVFAKETVTFGVSNGRKKRVEEVLVGCSESSRGKSLLAGDGVMGLGHSNYSFAHKLGGKFSYCLVDHLSPNNLSSYLIFGSQPQPQHARMQYTELLLGLINPFYAVSIKAISVGAAMLDIPPDTWDLDAGGGAIVDSGTSLTVLTLPAYKPLVAALQLHLPLERVDLGIGPLEYCFNSSTGFNETAVPKLVLHFSDGARLEPPVKSYVIDAAPGVKCLGFAAAAWPGVSVVGNILQQNHLWEFDILNTRLGFAPSSCL